MFLGAVQGFFEWLPVSSKSILMLLSTLIFSYTPTQSYATAIALQGGTVVSAVVYFHKYLVAIYRYERLLQFLLISTLVTGCVGVPVYLFTSRYLVYQLDPADSTLLIGVLLIVQMILRRSVGCCGYRGVESIRLLDAVVFGLAQSLSVLPGISRSGVTVLALLYLGYSVEDSLKLSFLASIPANMGATVVAFMVSGEEISIVAVESFAIALLTSSAVGTATIGLLIRASTRYATATQLLIALTAVVVGVALALPTW